jgi:carboxylate-amine ligase
MGASPTGGLPPHLDGWDAYVRLADRLAAAGFIETTKELWWDVRPSERHGTVEVRICDMPPGPPSVLGLSALIQCLVHDLAREDEAGRRRTRPA